ncbi:MAG: radical SAM family heme chaperone HemW [Oscillospiraceae bacterium]|nr:radical SAM family heme chaperone HemW [Oscillospiraceae bacterium]MDD4367470.1 radical SAM family heme chaperone HemW [Oscillospiraceae bacterium]
MTSAGFAPSNPAESQAVTALYLHIPFCDSKCLYCDFCSSAGQQQLYDPYVRAIQIEIKASALWLRQHQLSKPLETIYFGGGTPSVLGCDRLLRLLQTVYSVFNIAAQPEITLECNPLSAHKLDAARLQAAGFNRVSIGLQAAQDRLLKRLGRSHTVADFTDTVNALTAAGISNLSADLMIGLPGQTLTDVSESLTYLSRFPLKHLSFYSLIIEEGTPFAQAARKGQLADLPEPETERQMYQCVLDCLQDWQFEQYEVSNAALPGYASRHNEVYWDGRPYLACGLSAASYIGGVRRCNRRDLAGYLSIYGQVSSAEADWSQLAFAAADTAETIDRAEAQREFFWLGLRKLAGVRLSDYQQRFGQAPPPDILLALRRLCAEGLLICEPAAGPRYRLSRRGLDWGNDVFAAFV